MHHQIRTLWAHLGGDPSALARLDVADTDAVLPSTFDVGTAATTAIGAATLAAAELLRLRGGSAPTARVRVSARESAIAFQSERHLRVNGQPPETSDAFTRDYRARDGWVRLHCNYPHHREAAQRALATTDLASAIARLDAIEVEDAVHAAGGAAAAMRTRAEWARHPQATAAAQLPLVAIDRISDAPPIPLSPADRPLRNVRVLDLTRVLAGPVAGRTLAAHGADVLRVGADHLPLLQPLVIDTGFGKRFCHLDLRQGGRSALATLLAEADVLVQAYRPGALAAKGFDPVECAAIRPGLVYVDISAWGYAGPWRARRGFDSLVQMACGIAHEGAVAAGVDEPTPLPAQALDHATGFLAALGAMVALRRRHESGGSWHVRVSLARTAQWLDELPRIAPPTRPVATADLLETVETPWGQVTHVRPPGMIDGSPPRWDSPPHRPGSDAPRWQTLLV